MLDTSQFGGSFFITLVGLILSFLGGLSMYCLKSKCTKCTLCFGLIHIERDVEVELEEEKIELEKGIDYLPNNNNNPINKHN